MVTWQETIAVVVIFAAFGAGVFLVAQRPSFWIEFGSRLITRLWPVIWSYVSKRMDPETEARMRACHRSGGRWDNWKKRCLPPK